MSGEYIYLIIAAVVFVFTVVCVHYKDNGISLHEVFWCSVASICWPGAAVIAAAVAVHKMESSPTWNKKYILFTKRATPTQPNPDTECSNDR